MDLESRIVQIDDIIRQVSFLLFFSLSFFLTPDLKVLLNGTRVSGAGHGAKIDALTKQDLMRVARSMLETPPTIVSHGPKHSIEVVPSSRKIQMYLSSQLQKLK